MKDRAYFYDSNQVRYELAKQGAGAPLNWLFFPGGPGADSSYMDSLIELLDLPGNSWLIDLPGSGSHSGGSLDGYDFDRWFDIFLSTVRRFSNPIIVGHSFGGMLPLLFPDLESIVKGLVILNSAPKLWLQEAVEQAKRFDLPDLSEEMAAFTATPNQETFEKALDACVPYYFPKERVERGLPLVKAITFRYEPAVWWQRKAIEMDYSAKWVPQRVPTAIVGGKYDSICPFSLFQSDPRFQRENIQLYYTEKGGHFGWLESPELYVEAFGQLVTLAG